MCGWRPRNGPHGRKNLTHKEGATILRAHSSFFEHIGFTKDISNSGEVILNLTVQPEILTEEDMIPTGVFSSMLDIIIGSTIGENFKQPTTTINLNINFFDLANKGPFKAVGSIICRDEK